MVDKKLSKYLFIKRNIFYFSRHVPKDLRQHYNCDRIVKSLKTKCTKQASKLSQSMNQNLETYWFNLRLNSAGIPFKNLISKVDPIQSLTHAPKLSEALEIYFKLKGHGKGEIFFRASKRAIKDTIDLLKDRPIDHYTSIEAAKFRDNLFERKLASSSVKRVFAIIRAVINITIQEYGLECKNAFSGTFIPFLDDVKKRHPIPIETIKNIQDECFKINDPNRWLIALISDTGMRLAEATGLLILDICLDGTTPFVRIKPHQSRKLKTKSSERDIPLVGAALWAAKQIILNNHGKYAFPNYANDQSCKTNSASAALNKWLKPRVSKNCVIHSFRHSMRDRLREVNCPTEIIDQVGGWSHKTIGSFYGKGNSLENLMIFFKKINLCYNNKYS